MLGKWGSSSCRSLRCATWSWVGDIKNIVQIQPTFTARQQHKPAPPSADSWKNNINQLEIKILPCPGEISIIHLNWSRVTSNDIICFMFLWSWATRRWEDSATSRSNASAPLADTTVLFWSLLLSDYWVLYYMGCQDMHVPTSKVGLRMTRNPSIKRISKGTQLQVVTRNWLTLKTGLFRRCSCGDRLLVGRGMMVEKTSFSWHQND
jgi:hypothetical protein